MAIVKKSRYSLLLFFFCLCLGALTPACSGRYLDMSSFIYPGNDDATEPRIGHGEMIAVPSEDRLSRGYFSYGGKRLVVFFHGNGESMYHMESLARKFHRAGCSVLLAEYPGYGVSARYKSNEKDIYRDGEALIRFVQSRYALEPRDTVLLGYSLGSGVAVEMATRGLGAKLILVAPYTSTYDVAAHYSFPGLPRCLIRDVYETREKAPSLSMPVLIIHGKRDKTIPFRMGEELSRIFRDAAFIAVDDAGHGVIGELTGPQLWPPVLTFLSGPSKG